MGVTREGRHKRLWAQFWSWWVCPSSKTFLEGLTCLCCSTPSILLSDGGEGLGGGYTCLPYLALSQAYHGDKGWLTLESEVQKALGPQPHRVTLAQNHGPCEGPPVLLLDPATATGGALHRDRDCPISSSWYNAPAPCMPADWIQACLHTTGSSQGGWHLNQSPVSRLTGSSVGHSLLPFERGFPSVPGHLTRSFHEEMFSTDHLPAARSEAELTLPPHPHPPISTGH